MKNNVTANDIARELLMTIPRLRFLVVHLPTDAVFDPSATLSERAEIILTDKIATICEDNEPLEASNG